MSTDYTTYSIVYNCDESDMAYLWLLSRTPTLDEETISMAKQVIAEQLPNWDFNNWVFDEQATSKCKYPNSASAEVELATFI